jgi:hypothetical protein
MDSEKHFIAKMRTTVGEKRGKLTHVKRDYLL